MSSVPDHQQRDCRCVRSRHQHGTASAYQQDGCRCFPCRNANYQRAMANRAGLPWRDAGSTWHRCTVIRRLEALHCVGWSARALGDRLGVSRDAVNNLHRWPTTVIFAETARRVRDLYDELWDTAPPERTRGERISVQRTKAWAKRSGFAPPLAWDDDTIDDPGAQPSTLGETGDVDEFEVELLMAGERSVAKWARSAERLEAVRRLAARGMSDNEIGARLLTSGAAVLKVRERNCIPAGVPPLRRSRGIRGAA